MMQLLNGRPDAGECAVRTRREVRCYDFLDGLGVQYQRVDHPPADTMEVCAEIDRVLGAAICKNLVLTNRQQTNFYLLMILADKVFHTRDLSPQLGISRLSFASAGQMEQLLDVHPGSVSVLALMNDPDNRVRLLMDEDLKGFEFIGCHPCQNTSSLKLSAGDLFGKILPALHHQPTFVRLPAGEGAL